MEYAAISPELIEIVGPALAVGLMIAFVNAPLGLEVLRRGIIFIDLAIAQIAGLGLAAAGFAFDAPEGWPGQCVAFLAAVLAGLFFRLVERRAPAFQEAVIGCAFVLAASLTLLLLADHPHGGEEVQHLLSGQILFVTWDDAFGRASLLALVLLAWFGWPATRSGFGFFVLFAFAVTLSVPLVGVYVVFASLILPALAGAGSTRPLLAAWLCGVLAVPCGIFLSAGLDFPAGPLLVVAFVLVLLGMRLFRWVKTGLTAISQPM